MDGADVGRYNPHFDLVMPVVRNVTKEKFLEKQTEAIEPETKYPTCTSNGAKHCNLSARKRLRGSKSWLSKD